MKNYIKCLTALVCAVCVGMFLTACGSGKATWEKEKFDSVASVDKSALISEGKLTVAISPDYAPYEFLDDKKSGQSAFEGADVHFANYLAQSLGLELVLVNISFDNIFASIPGKKADIVISGLTYAQDRSENYFLTNSYYNDGEGGQVVVINKSDAATYTTLESLNSKDCKVAAQTNSLQYSLVVEQIPNCTITSISAITDGTTQLLSGKVDAIALSQYSAETLCEQNSDLMIISNDAFECVNSGLIACLDKNNTTLGSAVNTVISKMGAKQYDDWFKDAKALAIKIGQIE